MFISMAFSTLIFESWTVFASYWKSNHPYFHTNTRSLVWKYHLQEMSGFVLHCNMNPDIASFPQSNATKATVTDLPPFSSVHWLGFPISGDNIGKPLTSPSGYACISYANLILGIFSLVMFLIVQCFGYAVNVMQIMWPELRSHKEGWDSSDLVWLVEVVKGIKKWSKFWEHTEISTAN